MQFSVYPIAKPKCCVELSHSSRFLVFRSVHHKRLLQSTRLCQLSARNLWETNPHSSDLQFEVSRLSEICARLCKAAFRHFRWQTEPRKICAWFRTCGDCAIAIEFMWCGMPRAGFSGWCVECYQDIIKGLWDLFHVPVKVADLTKKVLKIPRNLIWIFLSFKSTKT